MSEPVGIQPPAVMVRIPCDKMSGTVLVRDQQALRYVHILALKHIQADGSVTQLLDAFGLGRQVMQEILADLIFDEAVRIDLEQDKAIVAEPYAAMLTADKIEDIQLKMYRTTEVKVTWLLDRISGEVFVDRDYSRYTRIPAGPTVWRDIKSPALEVPDIKQTSNALLARVAVPVIEERLGSRDFDISRVEQIEDKRKLRSETLYVPLKLLSGGSTAEEFAIPDAPGIPPQVRESWAALLNRGRTAPPMEPDRSSDEAAPHPVDVARQIQTVVAALHASANDDIGSAVIVARVEKDLRLLKALMRASDEIERSAGTHGTVVGNRDTQLEALAQLVEQAERQITICSAYTSEMGLASTLALVRDKAKAGVRVALVQGIAGSLDPTSTHEYGDGQGVFHTALRSVPQEARNNIVLARTRRPTHSKFVIVDGRTAAVSSCNWLSGSTGGPIEVTAVTRAQLPVAGVLDHAIDVLPNEILQLMQVPEALRRTKNREVRQIFFKKAFETVEAAWLKFFAEPGPSARGEFEAALGQVAGLLKSLQELRPATVVLDGEHRALMFRLLDQAKERAVVTSDRFAEDAAAGRLADVVGAVAGRGVRVDLRWGRQASLHDAEAQASAEAVKKFLARFPVRPPSLALPTAPSANHSKVVVCDARSVLVSSFNFLSFGADEARQSSRELGLLLQDPDHAKAVVDGLDGLFTIVADLEPRRGIAPANTGSDSSLLPRPRSRSSFVVPDRKP